MKPDPAYDITTDVSRFDMDLIHEFLANSYWARNIPRDVVERSIRHSLGFAAFRGNKQVGFVRVVTDYATIAYIGDLFVVPEHRQRGIARQLMQAILAHPELQGLRRFLLATRDAQGLYGQFGFEALAHPEHFMTIHRPDVYSTYP
ncbi:MAG: N-acetyltransferase [Verrucomicrobiaceae bacterium]|nr:MAG: N-acetyltransferase [Verrucomicrobiaceae bacterium]